LVLDSQPAIITIGGSHIETEREEVECLPWRVCFAAFVSAVLTALQGLIPLLRLTRLSYTISGTI